jgi:hypothetical protein
MAVRCTGCSNVCSFDNLFGTHNVVFCVSRHCYCISLEGLTKEMEEKLIIVRVDEHYTRDQLCSYACSAHCHII